MFFSSLSGAWAADLSAREKSLLKAINLVRVEYELSPLRVDGALQTAARSHSRDMIHEEYFAHGPMLQRLLSFRVRGVWLGENLAWGVGRAGLPGTVIQEWLDSTEHRDNLLRPTFRRIGIAAPFGRFAGHPKASVITADFAG